MTGPHAGQHVLHAGAPIAKAHAAMLLVHGRGASAADIMTVGQELMHPDFAYLAPQAAGNAWYPNPFTVPIDSNEPHFSSAISVLEEVLANITEHVPPERVILLGFSQGACLTLEFCARHARRYGGVVGFSGGLIGPDGTPRDYAGKFESTPLFLGCSDKDPHIPRERVELTASIMQQLGGDVTAKLYPNLAHTVNADEIRFVRTIMIAL